MRSRKVMLVSLVIVTTLGLFVGGCSKKSVAPTNPITNPQYDYVVDQVVASVDSLVDLSGLGLNMTAAATNSILTDIAFGPMPVDTASIVDLWHIFVLTNSGSGVSNHWVDSVQFLLDGVAQGLPLNANEMSYVRNWTQTSLDTTVSHTDITSHVELAAINTDQPSAVVAGQVTTIVKSVSKSGGETTTRDLTLSASISNFTVDRGNNWHGGCPQQGQMTIEGTLTVTPPVGAPVASTWLVDIDFLNGIATITVSESGLTFSFSVAACTL
jgi:hypothetical protein